MREELRRRLVETRARAPEQIAAAAASRQRRPALIGDTGRLMIIAADHTARGILSVGGRPMAMASRFDLLDRLLVALSRPGVDGVLGTADIIEDLLLLGALDGKVAVGSMNRGGLLGSVFEMDDRFTGYTAAGIVAGQLDAGKMLLRIDPSDPATVRTLVACGDAVSELAAARTPVMIEPFMITHASGRPRNDLTTDGAIRSVGISSGLGTTSAYTWLKLPVVAEMERVAEASTLPILLLGGDPSADQEAMFASWKRALRLPTVRGLVVGRSLLYPSVGDVAAAVDTAVSLL
ncbi:MAG TPA: aldolase [Streptosporangiaceae bacterium]|nr:aldolase [Streptosporangiaceae bacterium]